MKGKIDKNGVLWIERKGEMIKQQCMITKKFYPSLLHPSKTMAILCNHTCPLFSEPELRENENWEEVNGKPEWVKDGTTFVDLEICHRKNLIFDELIDERGGE